MGAVRGAWELVVATLSQEHGLIRAASPAVLEGRFNVGERLEIVPNHSCLTVPNFDEYHVVRDGGGGGDRWKIERGRERRGALRRGGVAIEPPAAARLSFWGRLLRCRVPLTSSSPTLFVA